MRRLAFLALLLAGCGGDLGDPPVPADMAALEAPIAARVREALAAVEDARGSAAARLELGKVYAANELYESARTALEQATAPGEAGARAWFYLALVRGELGDASGAIAAMERAASMESRHAPIHWQIGLWHLDLGDAQAAEDAFNRAVVIDPADMTAAIGLARTRLQQDDPGAAAELLEPLCADPATGPYPHHLLSLAYARLGRDDEARAAAAAGEGGGRPALHDAWRDALDDYKLGYQAQLERAERRAREGDYTGALAVLEHLTRDGEVTTEVRNNLGMCYLALGRHDDAVRALEAAVRQNPNSLQAQHMLAGAYWMSIGDAEGDELNRRRERVLRCVQKALAIDPAYVPSLGLKGDVYASAGNDRDAVAAYEEAARWDPGNPGWPLQIAVIEGQVGDFEAAAEALKRAIAIDPLHAEALARLGFAYIQLQRLSEAETALLRARAASPRPDPAIDEALRQVRQMREGTRR